MSKATDIQLALAARSAGWTSANDIGMAVAVALAESGGETTATHRNTNGTTDYGAWQVNSVHGFPTTQLMNLDGNAKAARTVFTRQGWNAWSTVKNGAYLLYLPRGRVAAAIAIDAPPGTAGGGRADTNIDVVPDSIQAPYESITKAIKALSDPNNWRRVGLFILGGLLVLVGLIKLTGNNQLSSTTKSAVKTAAKIAVTRKA